MMAFPPACFVVLQVKDGVVEEGMVGYRFNTIGVSDGISMGTRGGCTHPAAFVVSKVTSCRSWLRKLPLKWLQAVWPIFHNSCLEVDRFWMERYRSWIESYPFLARKLPLLARKIPLLDGNFPPMLE